MRWTLRDLTVGLRVLLIGMLIGSMACTPRPDAAVPAAEAVSASPVPSPVSVGPPTVVIRRGSIDNIVNATGRVTDSTETGLSFSSAVRVATVSVEPGERVDRGQVLAEADVAAIQTELSGSKARLDQARARVETARAVINTRLQRATSDVTRLTAPPSQADQLTAEMALSTARANLRRTEADLAQARTPKVTPTDIQAADQDIATATIQVKKAEAALEKLRQGADPVAIRKAENDILVAEGGYSKAQDVYRQLVKGPDPYDVRGAERAVSEAEEGLRVAQQVKPLPAVSSSNSGNSKTERDTRARAQAEAQNQRLQYEATVRRAEIALENARDRLAKLTQGPTRAEVTRPSEQLKLRSAPPTTRGRAWTTSVEDQSASTSRLRRPISPVRARTWRRRKIVGRRSIFPRRRSRSLPPRRAWRRLASGWHRPRPATRI